MAGVERLGVFVYHSQITFSKNNGWQHAPLPMIFNINQQNPKHKAHLVVDGQILNSSNFVTYCSTIQDLWVGLLMIVVANNGMKSMVSDVGYGFCTAPIDQKVWLNAGPEFLDHQGCKVS